ncbi:hypothetical protein K438DRAFT_1993683 [Mycena galopus ATCC 62051]|nr:hypothetical protein K438DRAFT_1993683 [Mycena galopus ATCC 62051]
MLRLPKKKSTSAAKTEGLVVFWLKLFEEYWTRFPWRLPLKDEPPPPSESQEPVSEDLFDPLDLNLSMEEADRKSEIQKKTKEKIKHWFLRQRPGAMAIHGNPFFTHLVRMHHNKAGGPPSVQLISSSTCAIQNSTTPWRSVSRRSIQMHQESDMEEPDDVRERIKTECDEAHAEDIEAYKEGEDEPLPDAETQPPMDPKYPF